MSRVEHIAGSTTHVRKGGISNRFTYGVDYVLLDMEEERPEAPALFSRNGRNLASVSDRDCGGPPGHGRGPDWVRDVLRDHLPGLEAGRIAFLTQPRLLGHLFNPVSFWLVYDPAGALRLVIAEVTNTFGDRHSYLCHRDDLGPIGPEDELSARKVMHVSPFQPVEGGYRFRFDIRPDRIAIRIDYRQGNGGLVASLAGPRAPLTTRSLLTACLRRPVGSVRVLALIFWQALKLRAKGAAYRRRPAPPAHEIGR